MDELDYKLDIVIFYVFHIDLIFLFSKLLTLLIKLILFLIIYKHDYLYWENIRLSFVIFARFLV